jgi:hypothetical protein
VRSRSRGPAGRGARTSPEAIELQDSFAEYATKDDDLVSIRDQL